MQTLKFRQRNIREGTWHYWGFIDGAWIDPKHEDGFDTPITSGQFTGLSDSFGREIFEHDVVTSKYGDLGPCVVRWGFCSKDYDGEHPKPLGFHVGDHIIGTSVNGEAGTYLTIIGNLTDNPEFRNLV